VAKPPQEAATRKIPCKMPENASMCYWTRGRVTLGAGTGDFEVCPLEPERPGWMQAACIESAKNIFIQDWTKILENTHP
jgi:hypothetical protein